jgi:hypothetical protein
MAYDFLGGIDFYLNFSGFLVFCVLCWAAIAMEPPKGGRRKRVGRVSFGSSRHLRAATVT